MYAPSTPFLSARYPRAKQLDVKLESELARELESELELESEIELEDRLPIECGCVDPLVEQRAEIALACLLHRAS
jgi:hypothetical protein